jgi:hypothetical protein
VKSHQIATASPAVSGILDNSRGRLVWFAFRETTGIAGAVFRLWDGSNNAGKDICPVSLNPSESTREYIGHISLPYETGLFLEVVSGSVEGSVLVISHDELWGDAMPVVVVGNITVEVGQ